MWGEPLVISTVAIGRLPVEYLDQPNPDCASRDFTGSAEIQLRTELCRRRYLAVLILWHETHVCCMIPRWIVRMIFTVALADVRSRRC